jgi:hypothetical protein
VAAACLLVAGELVSAVAAISLVTVGGLILSPPQKVRRLPQAHVPLADALAQRVHAV